VIAALLHDVLDDTAVQVQELEQRFGPKVGRLGGAGQRGAARRGGWLWRKHTLGPAQLPLGPLPPFSHC
jgi:hypothetical protein